MNVMEDEKNVLNLSESFSHFSTNTQMVYESSMLTYSEMHEDPSKRAQEPELGRSEYIQDPNVLILQACTPIKGNNIYGNSCNFVIYILQHL